MQLPVEEAASLMLSIWQSFAQKGQGASNMA